MDKKTLVINTDTIAAAGFKGNNLWKQANDKPHMILLAPEQLISKEFGDLVKENGMLLMCTCTLVVDEAHLLNTWGTGFCKAYWQIGWVCLHL
ncbi:hypothetical protein L208DRAFT_1252756 [Tricholoma matsutake]|nr:hypothetical protein L208DRAFT_1252756 [Tricholoma matsutake 945]